jgi:hypothetical protein
MLAASMQVLDNDVENLITEKMAIRVKLAPNGFDQSGSGIVLSEIKSGELGLLTPTVSG